MSEPILKKGDTAPDFELMDEKKNKVKLSDLRGKKVVLLFYPMDFSPTCTQEHCTFGPELPKIVGKEDAIVFGVSTDGPFSRAAFKKQYGIPYDLRSDTSRKVSKAYNLFAGEEPYNCSKRGTVVIDKNGKISFWQEQPMKEPRRVSDLSKAVIAVAFEDRENEGGSAV